MGKDEQQRGHTDSMKGTGILGIPNRTENWLTASTFAAVIAGAWQNELAAQIIGKAKGTQLSFRQDEVQLELYWKGFRDYCKSKGKNRKSTAFIRQTADRYQGLFPSLRERIEDYNKRAETGQPSLNLKEPRNYRVSDNESTQRLYNNLLNTEIDIVLSAPGYLLIGEAKHEETFGADSQHVLVHQLVRQYVMASMVADMVDSDQRRETKTEVIPFIVGDKVKKAAQVQLLQYMNMLHLDNVISWDQLKQLIGA